MFKNILLPTDGSKLSEKAVKRAIALAKAHKAKLTGVHVFSSKPRVGYAEVAAIYDLVRERLRQYGKAKGKKYLDRIQALAKCAGVKFDRIVVENDLPWDGIIRVARKTRCDVIAMAARKHGWFSSLLFGSETREVLARSEIRVLVYR